MVDDQEVKDRQVKDRQVKDQGPRGGDRVLLIGTGGTRVEAGGGNGQQREQDRLGQVSSQLK